MSRWFLYIVECSDGSYYTGITTNIERRLLEHNCNNKKGAKYTRSRRPVNLIYSEEYKDRSAASKKECMIKKKTKKEKIKFILKNNKTGK